MAIRTGISKAWRTALIGALQGHELRVALFYVDADLDPLTVTVYDGTTGEGGTRMLGEINGVGYTPGGFILNTTLNDAGEIPFLDFDDVFISGFTVTNLGGLMIYDVTDGNAVIALISLSPRTYINRDVQIIWPTANINSAVLRVLG